MAVYIICYIVTLQVFTKIQGQPQLVSSISSLSGSQCPGKVIFTCNALEFGSQIISWYVNDTRLLKYSYSEEDDFPLTVPSSSSGLRAQIHMAFIQNSRFNYVKFTLFANLEDLLQFQGQLLTCGTIAQRSNYFKIEYYEIYDYENSNFDITTTLIFHGQNKSLANILLNWDDFFARFGCNFPTIYSVNMSSNGDIVYTNVISSEDCVRQFCSTTIVPKFPKEIYDCSVNVTGNNTLIQRSNQFNIYANIGKKTVDFTKLSDTTISLHCGKNIDGNCIVSWMTRNSHEHITLKPNATQIINIDKNQFYIFEILLFINSTQLIWTFYFEDHNISSSTLNQALISLPFVFIGAVLMSCLICGIAQLMINKYKQNTAKVDIMKNNEDGIVMKRNHLYEMQSGSHDNKASSIKMKKNKVYELAKENCNQNYEQ